MKSKLIINLDEISNDFDESISFLKSHSIDSCELRLINGQNLALMSKNEIYNLKKKLQQSNVVPLSIASPIFKWFNSKSNNMKEIDDFGIDPHLSVNQQKEIISNILRSAKILEVNKIRIFSFLDTSNNPVDLLTDNVLFSSLLKEPYEFLIENEPVCGIYSKSHIINLVEKIKAKNYTNIRIWFDIANFIRSGEVIDEEFIKTIAPYIGYIHCKDYIQRDSYIEYVPVGSGVISYPEIFTLFHKHIANHYETIISIETHANNENKLVYSLKSIEYMNKILEGLK